MNSIAKLQIKICGLTNLPDTLAAVEAGADYLGFNFYDRSPRCISPEACARLRGELLRRGHTAITVGIFVNHSPVDVAALLDYCGLDLAQLHGEEQPEQLVPLWGRAFKSVRDPRGQDFEALRSYSPGRPAFLLDANTAGAYGGTGTVGDWGAARPLAERYPLFLAGGLTPANVGAAIQSVRPWGVDVASGVEAEPGRKDHAKLQAFTAAARAAAAEIQGIMA
jgi:phosphoribosylanthranilate isomerase